MYAGHLAGTIASPTCAWIFVIPGTQAHWDVTYLLSEAGMKTYKHLGGNVIGPDDPETWDAYQSVASHRLVNLG